LIKNLLLLKNELLALEIGDVRSNGSLTNMQHFGQIWDTLLRRPHNLMGLLGSLTTYIPGSSYWSSASRTGTPVAGAAGAEVQDASEQLDEQLRQSIYAFTRRWAAAVNEAAGGKKAGGKSVAKVERELEEMLERAFASQPEVVGKLKEAIQIEAAQQAEGGKKGGVRG
jgi:conserved oligomeric Golgi complex subunit 3